MFTKGKVLLVHPLKLAAIMNTYCRQVVWRTRHIRAVRFASTEGKKVNKFPRRVFSGIQPTGVPHLGNYVGAIRNWVRLQDEYQGTLFSIVDLHAITVPQDATALRENIYAMTASLLACGIDPEKCILFQQSTVPHHTELSWILGCLCSMPRLQHLPQWREKSQSDSSIGLFTYPILQSADILLYKATSVPVGEDQVHHIELARDLAKAFNRTFGEIFPSPTADIGNIAKIRSLQNPTKKMSKSDVPQSRIELTDGPDAVSKKIRKAVTDSNRQMTYDPEERPGLSNLLDIQASLTGLSVEQLVKEQESLNKVELKEKLTEVINEQVQPIRSEILRMLDDKTHLRNILEMGREKAMQISTITLEQVKIKVGFR